MIQLASHDREHTMDNIREFSQCLVAGDTIGSHIEEHAPRHESHIEEHAPRHESLKLEIDHIRQLQAFI